MGVVRWVAAAAAIAFGAMTMAAPGAAESRLTGPVPVDNPRSEAGRGQDGRAWRDSEGARPAWRYRRICRTVWRGGHRTRLCRSVRAHR